jgi:hypothetical protein
LDTNPSFRRTSGLRFRVLLAGDAGAREEFVGGLYQAYTPSDPVQLVVIAGDMSVYWESPI